MNFELWYRFGTAPYQQVDLERPFKLVYQHKDDPPIVLVESLEEQEILEGMQYVYGGQLDIRIVEPSSSCNPFVYNRDYLFYTFNPIERAGQ